jgi:hypothetical protein
MPGSHYGDFPTSHTAVTMVFDSFAASTGASSATSNFASSDVTIWKDGGTTQRSSSAGITVTTSFDSQTGLQMVVIDLSDNTDAGFYAAGHEYQVGIADVTIDGQTVRFWLGSFSIERAGGVLAYLKAGSTVAASVTGAVGSVTGAVGSVTGAVGSVTGNVGGNVVGSVASVTAAVSANVTKVNGTAVSGSGTAGSPWGP